MFSYTVKRIDVEVARVAANCSTIRNSRTTRPDAVEIPGVGYRQ